VLGRLVALRVHDGDRVKKGQVVAVLERVQPALSVEQARANVDSTATQVRAARAAYDLQAKTYHNDLVQARSGVRIAGSRLGQAGENLGIEISAAALAIDQARAQLTAAQVGYAHANVNLIRAKSLVATGDAPRQSLDDATDAYESAAAQLRAAEDAVRLAQASQRNVQVRRLDVASSQAAQHQSVAVMRSAEAERDLVAQRHAQYVAAQGQLAQAKAALGIAQDQERETMLVAPYDGYVISHNFELGDLVQPATSIMTIGDLVHPYLYVYVSETDLPHVKLRTMADVRIDGMPNRVFHRTVTEISNTAEFTPENVQTKAERIEYLVFRVKIQFADTSGSLKPGLPADAVIHF
jgi:HlyD family secretion protein